MGFQASLQSTHSIESFSHKSFHAEMQRFDVGGKPAMAFEMPIDRLKPERLMCYRDELNSHITREALRLQPSIRLQLDAQVSHVDLDKQQLTFSHSGKPSEVRCCSLAPLVALLHRPVNARQLRQLAPHDADKWCSCSAQGEASMATSGELC